jgi:hypothetical protein
MDSLELTAGLLAARDGAAVQVASCRHVHLSRRLFGIAGYHLAGEIGAPIGILFGTSRDKPKLVVMGEPRNRDLRFQNLVPFATAFNRYVMGFDDLFDVTRSRRGGGTYTYADIADAPQLLVPNRATATWITATMGRSLRYLRTDGAYPVDPALPAAGAHLTFFEGRRAVPGSSMTLVATEALGTHWVTPQTAAEDESLATLLAWIDPLDGLTGEEAAAIAENQLPLGPVPDPGWDNEVLAPAIAAFNEALERGVSENKAADEVREVVTEALMPAWEQVWEATDLLGALPAAAHVPERWADDRRRWAFHVGRVQAGTAWFRRVADALGAARLLRRAEDATDELARQMALDDPFVMARSIAMGEAVEGTVTLVDSTHTERAVKRTRPRPLVTLEPYEQFNRPVGTELFWAANPKLRAVVEAVSQREVVLKIMSGIGRGSVPDPGSLPSVGDDVVFSPFSSGDYYRDTLPDQAPWTHQFPVIDDSDHPDNSAVNSGAGREKTS